MLHPRASIVKDFRHENSKTIDINWTRFYLDFLISILRAIRWFHSGTLTTLKILRCIPLEWKEH